MLETKELRVRVTPVQYSIIKTKAEVLGFKTISEFVRQTICRVPQKTEQRLLEIYKELKRREP